MDFCFSYTSSASPAEVDPALVDADSTGFGINPRPILVHAH
jgi:hypothetical protein